MKDKDINFIMNKLETANKILGPWYHAVDREWEKLKEEYIEVSGDSSGYLPYLKEMSEQARQKVGNNPTDTVYNIIDEVADTFLSGEFEERELLSEKFANSDEIERTHLGYIDRTRTMLLRTKEALWFQRGLAVAAMGQGGRDFRDLYIALKELSDAGLKVGINISSEFKRIAKLSSDKKGKGGLKMSIKEYLIQFIDNFMMKTS